MGSELARALERSAVVRLAVRWRWVVLSLAAVAAGLLEAHSSGPSSDGPYFALAGRHLLSSNGLHVYADKGLQAGPLQVAAFGLISYVTGWLHLPEDATFAVISTVLSTLFVTAGARVLRRRFWLPQSPGAETAIGLVAVGSLMAAQVYLSGHPAELVIPALWVAGAVAAFDGRPWAAGLLVGLGSGFETWALLGVPVLLLAPGWTRWLKGCAAALGLTAALYLPFVVAGPFRMGRAVWPIASGSLVHAIDPRLATFPWSARLLQSVVVVALGAGAAWVLRRSQARPELAVWLVPAVIALAKAVSDPSGYVWYWLPVQLVPLAGLALADRTDRATNAELVGLEILGLTTTLHAWPVGLAALVVLLGVTGWQARRSRPGPARRQSAAAIAQRAVRQAA